MSYRKCRYQTGNFNGGLGDTDRRNCNGVLGANDPCNRRNYPTADALEDAYNQGYRDGVKAGREQGLLKSCLNAKQEDWDYIVEIECC